MIRGLTAASNQGTPAAVANGWPVKITDGAHTAAVSSDGRLLTTVAPENYQFYFYSLIDAPGVVAANNFISIFNPSNSGKVISFFSIAVDAFASGASGTAVSLRVDRISAASVGTVITATNINKLLTSEPNSIADVRVGNPTVTKVGSSLYSWPPPVSTGSGVGATVVSSVPPGEGFYCFPGEGINLSTSAGNTNQVWSIKITWAEF